MLLKNIYSKNQVQLKKTIWFCKWVFLIYRICLQWIIEKAIARAEKLIAFIRKCCCIQCYVDFFQIQIIVSLKCCFFIIELQVKELRFNKRIYSSGSSSEKSRGNKSNRELSSKLSDIKNLKCLFYFQISMWFKYIHTF